MNRNPLTTPENLPMVALGNCKIWTELKIWVKNRRLLPVFLEKKEKMGKKISHTYKLFKNVFERLMQLKQMKVYNLQSNK